MCESNAVLICAAMRRHPKLTGADLRVYDALLSNPDWSQPQIAQELGLSVPTVKRSVATLQEKKLIDVHRFYDRKAKLTRNSYSPGQGINIDPSPQEQGAKVNHLPNDQGIKNDTLPLDQSIKNDPSVSPQPSQIAQNERSVKNDPLHESMNDMKDWNRDKDNFSEVLGLLNWVAGVNRERLARRPHMTLEYAHQAHQWFYARMYPDHVEDPAAWLFKIVWQGDPIPALQYQLPGDGDEAAGAIELPTKDEELAVRDVAAEVARLIPEVYPLAGEKWKKHYKRIVREHGPDCGYDIGTLAQRAVYEEL